MADYTLAFSESAKGWTSFFSYVPDWMIGLNNRFYSFSGGNLYEHNSDNVARNNFYGQQYTTQVTTIFNESPIENKLFKTIALQGDDSWDVTINSDIQTSGNIDQSWFTKKEQEWFAFIRNSGTVPVGNEQLSQRSVQGISRSSSFTGTSGSRVVNFALSVNIGSNISIGDYLYSARSPYTSLVLAGQVTNVEVDKPNGINRITFDDTIGGATTPLDQDEYYAYVKNQTAESTGILGHYAIVFLENDNTNATELFAVESELFKSFP